MNRTSLRRIAAPSVAALALGLAVSACGAGNETAIARAAAASDLSGKLDGAGSSAQESAMDAWRAGFQKENSGVTVNYDPAGSGAGLEKFIAGGVDFAGSDSALDAEKGELDAAKKRCGGDAIEVPDYVSPIAVVFNLEGVDKPPALAQDDRRHLRRQDHHAGTTRPSRPTTPTPSCRRRRSTRCTAPTSPAPPRTSPTTWRRPARAPGRTPPTRCGRSSPARAPTRPPA